MTIELMCAQCGKTRRVELSDTDYKPSTTVETMIQKVHWIAQKNGAHCDLYCSKKCAE